MYAFVQRVPIKMYQIDYYLEKGFQHCVVSCCVCMESTTLGPPMTFEEVEAATKEFRESHICYV